MIYSNLHTHTTFCDGANTPREMVEAAISCGFRSIGFSGHGYVRFDETAGMSLSNMQAYSQAICGLKVEYANIIDVFHGLENDSAQMHNSHTYDYTIGSVHFVQRRGIQCCVDHTKERLEKGLAQCFDGDGQALFRAYYEEVIRLARLQSSDVPADKSADICGHFDVIKKFNKHNCFFDEQSPAYRRAALEALEAVVQSGMILEVNTASIAKGVSTEPYPAVFLLKRAQELGARVIISSDAHAAQLLCYAFPEMEVLLSSLGFKETWELTKKGFVPIPLA